MHPRHCPAKRTCAKVLAQIGLLKKSILEGSLRGGAVMLVCSIINGSKYDKAEAWM